MNAGLPNDTHPKIGTMLIEGYCKVSPMQKLERVRALTQAVQDLAQHSRASARQEGCLEP